MVAGTELARFIHGLSISVFRAFMDGSACRKLAGEGFGSSASKLEKLTFDELRLSGNPLSPLGLLRLLWLLRAGVVGVFVGADIEPML